MSFRLPRSRALFRDIWANLQTVLVLTERGTHRRVTSSSEISVAYLIALARLPSEASQLGNRNPPRLKLAETQVRKRRRRNALLLGTACLVALIVAGFLLLPHASARKIDKSIAVLPFQNLSDEKENTYFADGIQDDILTNLSKI